jgi:hypothetical protein
MSKSETSRILSVSALPYSGRSALRRGNTNLAEQLNSGNPEPVPDSLAPFHKASPSERDRRVRDVLQWAHWFYRQGDCSMCGAIDRAVSGGSGDPAGEYAKLSLRRILLELNLVAWESHPNRTRQDVHRLFRKAIGKLSPHAGGWRVTR